jgi:hypothetical protein
MTAQRGPRTTGRAHKVLALIIWVLKKKKDEMVKMAETGVTE